MLAGNGVYCDPMSRGITAAAGGSGYAEASRSTLSGARVPDPFLRGSVDW